MPTEYEVVYLGHDNWIDRELTSEDENGVQQPADLENATEMTVTIDGVTVVSTDKANGAIKWDQPGYALGQVRIAIGDQDLAPGKHIMPIVVYDVSNPDGVVWDEVPVQVFAEVEIPRTLATTIAARTSTAAAALDIT